MTNMIERNTPFEDLEPLITYLDVLERATVAPSLDVAASLDEADKILTARAVLTPHNIYIPNEGHRIYGYRPLSISESAVRLTRLASYEPDSEEYSDAFFTEWLKKNNMPPTDYANPEYRRDTARAALITLGGKLAVSGAFMNHHVGPAYGVIEGSLYRIGRHDSNEDFAKFGISRIRRYLHKELALLHSGDNLRNPIAKIDAKDNIKSALDVVGWPGIFRRMASYL